MPYRHIEVPAGGEPIAIHPDGSLDVPDRPIVVCIRGDGIGADVTPVMTSVVEAAVERAYGARRHIAWLRAWAGEEAAALYDGACL
ncbi:MAG TPA: NADP-dependent isocitrate dehydrogenase, partial [Gammaproteobacteria bacterium]|nr:NADP-dependent isocitrate dehydrogenase [Gammaproteobacteria bacterium]